MKPLVVEYNPLPVFRPFHADQTRERYLFGGYGSGKSVAGCAEVLKQGMEQPGSEWLITRKTVPALRDTTEKTFVSLIPPDLFEQCDVGRAGGHYEHITLPCGTTFYFRSMDDWKKHRSMNLTGILWDEADEFTLEDFEGMNSRVRQVHPTPQAKKQGAGPIRWRGHILVSNPQGHNWLWARAVNPATKAAGTQYWVSTTLDNPYIPSDTLENWLAMPRPWVERYIFCSFDEFGGAIYSDWSYETHVLPMSSKDFLERHRKGGGFFVQGFDPGTAAGNGSLWCYYDLEKARYIGLAEDFVKDVGLPVPTHARNWRRIEAQLRMVPMRDRIADPKAIPVRDRGTGITLDHQYRQHGFSFRPGVNDVDSRVTALGQLIFQQRFVVTQDCMQTFEQIKGYRWKDLTPMQVEKGKAPRPVKKDVELVDCAQYIATRYQSVPNVKARPPEDVSVEQQLANETWGKIKQQLRRKNAKSSHDLGTVRV